MFEDDIFEEPSDRRTSLMLGRCDAWSVECDAWSVDGLPRSIAGFLFFAKTTVTWPDALVSFSRLESLVLPFRRVFPPFAAT